MRPGQEKIYYITADSFNTAKSSPHLEVFRKKQVEVLLLHDRIDEWLVNHLPEYEKIAFQSVARGDIDLSGVGVVEGSEEKAREDKKETELKTVFEPVIDRIKKVLGESVKDVRLSHRLTSSPACLVADENDMGFQLQRLLKQLASKPGHQTCL